jgi:hypothetical protein
MAKGTRYPTRSLITGQLSLPVCLTENMLILRIIFG